MATYAIGDIQGCLSALDKLLKLIHFNADRDHLWFVGDLVNRGPQSLETLRFIYQLGPCAIVVLGNHDLHLLALAHDAYPHVKKHNLDDVLSAPDCDELLNWLQHRPLLHHDSHLDFVMTHAGLPPVWDLYLAKSCAREAEKALQGPFFHDMLRHMYGNTPCVWDKHLEGWERLRFIFNALTRMRYCDCSGRLDFSYSGTPGSQPHGLQPWFQHPKRVNTHLRIVHGHWAALQGNFYTQNVFSIDGGYIWGGELIALRLDDLERFSVKALKA